MVASRQQNRSFGRLFSLEPSRNETRETDSDLDTLALKHPPPPSEIHVVEPERRRDRAVLRALVVDHDDERRAAVRTLLERERFVVDGAESEGAAWHALDRGRYDLLFVDVSAERERALSLIEHAKTPRARVTTPVVVATGTKREPEAMFQTLRAGALDYLAHPEKRGAKVTDDDDEHGWTHLPQRLHVAAEVCGRMRSLDDEAAAIASEIDAIHGELRSPSSVPSSLAGGPERHDGVVSTGHVRTRGALGCDAFAVARDDLGRTTAVLIDLGQRGVGSAMQLASARVAAVAALERGKNLQQTAMAVAEACDGDDGRPASPGLTLVRLTPGARLVEVLCAGMPAVVGATAAGELRTFPCTSPRLDVRGARLVRVERSMVRPGEGFLLASDGLTLGALDDESAELLARRIAFDRSGASMAHATTAHLRALVGEALGGAARTSDDASLGLIALDEHG